MDNNLTIYKVSCPSTCGSYFGSYLQSVTVIATTKEDALTKVKDWLEKEDRKFIYPEEKWWVQTLGTLQDSPIIEWLEDSDY